MLASKTVQELLDAFASPTPTPGGGSAAALAGATAASLLAMVAGMPKTRNNTPEDKAALDAALPVLQSLRTELTSLIDRDAEDRLLPLAAEKGLGVIINRPFQQGNLLDRFLGKPLPDWSQEIASASWPQFLLKFIISHPAVTCVIPATSRADHMRENMAALSGLLPDQAMRKRMIDYIETL